MSHNGDKPTGQPPLGPAKIGAVRTWLALDDFNGFVYPKNYTLRAIRAHVEVWVANNLAFPSGDCRNLDAARLNVTMEKAQYLADEFEDNMYPLESAAFSVPPDRNGKQSLLRRLAPGLAPPAGFKGEGENIVVLVDNVRDANFYDADNANTLPYIAGFFWSFFNDLFDRNVMTVDSWDWLHRTTAEPPDNPSTDPCTSAPARPFLYEGVFAHEYQHLLEHYEDSDETNWINEGLSDWAQTLTGYVDPSQPITSADFDSHIQCFLGWLSEMTAANPIPRPNSGPENSLTQWGDQGDGEILCDYGAAYTMMELLADRYGEAFMSALHREDANGFAGLQAVLDDLAPGTAAFDVLHEWAAMVALDSILDDGATLNGGTASDYQVSTLDASIKWSTPHAYNTPGAPPNGSDYVRLRDGTGTYRGADAIESISFDGAATHDPLPVEWVVDAVAHDGGPAFYSGAGDLLDRMIAMQVMVPAVDPTLRFDARWQTEQDWDFGYVQVSTDSGETWTSLSTADTTNQHDPNAHPLVVANLPGFSGDSGGWRAQTADLSAYAGQNVHIAFRYITDWAVTEPGFWVDNIAIGGTLISDGSDLSGWMSQTQVNGVDVFGFTVQLIAYADGGSMAWVGEIPLDANFDGTLSGAALDAVIGTTADVVAAIVTYDEPTELITQYAPYVLTVDGVVQPGG